MNSMTGFGKAELVVDGRKLHIEIKSVNNRFLDLNIRQPRFLMQYEERVRKQIKNSLNRGRVDVFVNYSSEREDAKKVVADASLVLGYVKISEEIAAKTGIENDLAVSHVLRLPDVVSFEEDSSDEQALEELLTKCLAMALAELIKAREREGRQLQRDMETRLNTLWQATDKIAAKENVVVQEYKQKLQDRINELLDNSAVLDEQRLAQEVAIYADKANITEEVVRIRSHITQFKKLAAQAGAQGRNMDFIVQELNREFNTIGSKSQDSELLQTVIAAKGEVEKIREQIQNIE